MIYNLAIKEVIYKAMIYSLVIKVTDSLIIRIAIVLAKLLAKKIFWVKIIKMIEYLAFNLEDKK